MKRGYFGIGVYHSKNADNIGTLWRSAAIFGADFIFTNGIGGYGDWRAERGLPKNPPLNAWRNDQ